MSADVNSSNRWLVGIGAALVALVAVTLVVVFAGDRRATVFAAETPEGSVQRYLEALAEDHLTAAYDYLSPELKDACAPAQWRETARYSRPELTEGLVLLTDVRKVSNDSEMLVEVTFRRFAEPGLLPLPPREQSYTQQFVLSASEDGVWRFVEQPWPNPWACPPKRLESTTAEPAPVEPVQPVPAE